MKSIIFLVLLFACCASLSAQSTNTFLSRNSFGFQFVPLPLVDRNPKLRLGIEFRPDSPFGYSLEIGWANHAFKDLPLQGSVWGENYSAFEIRPQVKWYFHELPRLDLYLSTEIFYSKLKDRLLSNRYSNGNDNEFMFYEQADLLKEKLGIHGMVGSKVFVTPHLFVEYYAGMGLAHRNHIYSNVINPSPSDLPLEEWFSAEYRFAGKKWVTQYPLGFKIGVLIK